MADGRLQEGNGPTDMSFKPGRDKIVSGDMSFKLGRDIVRGVPLRKKIRKTTRGGRR